MLSNPEGSLRPGIRGCDLRSRKLERLWSNHRNMRLQDRIGCFAKRGQRFRKLKSTLLPRPPPRPTTGCKNQTTPQAARSAQCARVRYTWQSSRNDRYLIDFACAIVSCPQRFHPCLRKSFPFTTCLKLPDVADTYTQIITQWPGTPREVEQQTRFGTFKCGRPPIEAFVPRADCR